VPLEEFSFLLNIYEALKLDYPENIAEQTLGAFVTKEYRDLKIEKSKVEKFDEKYQDLFTKREFDGFYCEDNFDLSLIGGFIYNQFSCIRTLLYPYVNIHKIIITANHRRKLIKF
jgi:hypothetical protein